MPRIFKQFIYCVFYLTILGIVGFGAYKIYFPPTPPPPPCPTCDLKVESEDVVTVPFTSQTSSFLVKIKNPSSEYGLKRFDYQFRIFSSLGPPIRSISGTSSLYPGEEKYIAVSNVDIVRSDIGIVNFEPLSLPWESRASFGAKYNITITETHADNQSEFLRVAGRLLNNSSKDPLNTNVIVSLSDSDSKIVAIGTQSFTGIKPFGTEGFRIFLQKVKYQDYSVYIDYESY